MAIAPKRAKMGAPPSSRLEARWGTVLAVDDDPSTREAIKVLLSPHCSTFFGKDGREALRLAEQCSPDLILLDIGLPDLSGLEVCRVLKSRSATCEIPVCFLTQIGDDQSRLEAFDAGAADFIVKPVDAPIVKTRVRNLLESRKRLLHALQLSDARWRFALEGSEFGMWEWNVDTGQFIASPSLCHLIGLPTTDHTLSYDDWLDWVHPQDRGRVESHLQSLADGALSSQDLEYRMRTLDEALVWMRERARVVQRTDGRPRRIMALVSDTTERRTSERRILKLSRFDPVTELPNRKACLEFIAEEIQRCRLENQTSCVLRVDLSGLARVNHAMGRSAGDELLLQAASRLREFSSTPYTAYQFGGKEFALVVQMNEGSDPQALALRIGSAIRGKVSVPFTIHEEQVMCDCHIGASLITGAQDTPEELIRRAEVALIEARKQGKGVSLFAREMLERIAERARIQGDLEQAVFTNQFSLAYQPIVAASGKLIGVEALARWNHPERGSVRPDHFIPIAEESGLIIPLGARLRRMACEQLVLWAKNPSTQQIKMSVNVSPAEFMATGFVRDLKLLTTGLNFDPALLQLELTESLLLTSFEEVAECMNQIRDLGIGFALDDFGTGYSSLTYLKKLPFQRLKVDRSFVRDLLTNPIDQALSRTIIAMAHNLGLEIVAEGVEDGSQVQLLSEMGCSMFQGYLFGRPGPAKDISERAKVVAIETDSLEAKALGLAEKSTLPPSSRAALTGSASILVVDDDKMTLDLVRQILNEYTHVRCTTDPHEGKRLALISPPDVLILNQSMDEHEGIELWDELRRNPALSDLPVIFLTASDDPEAEVRAFSVGAVDFISKPISAARLSIAVENQLQRKLRTDHLKREASIDPLTGTANRRSFSRALRREISRAQETGTPVSLIMIDVDHLKSINDRSGYSAGDVCLELLSAILKKQVHRESDVVARYGGEEFTLLMPLVQEDEAQHRAHAIVRAVETANIGQRAGIDGEMTVSVGWATIYPRGVGPSSANSLVETADRALLKAKERGRNCVCGPDDLSSLFPLKSARAH